MSTLGMLNGLKSWLTFESKARQAGMSIAVLNSARGPHQDMGLNLAQSILIDKQL